MSFTAALERSPFAEVQYSSLANYSTPLLPAKADRHDLGLSSRSVARPTLL
jgi:hypothetical protein